MAAMQQHVERGLVQVLKKAVADAPNVADPMIEFGRAYVVFFAQNPAYYAFFTRQEGIRVVFSQSGVQSSTYAPFDLFVKQAREHLGQLGVPQAQQMAAMAGMWATVHGLAGMATMPGVQFDGDWGELTEKVLMGVHPDEG